MVQTTEKVDKPDPHDYLAPIWRHRWIILALALMVALATYLYYGSKAKSYESSTDIYLGTSGVEELVTGTDQTGTEREVANQARVLRSRAVAARVARKIGFNGDPEELLGALEVVADPEADIVTLSAVWGDPRRAARLANEFAHAFLDQRLATRREDADRALESARGAMAELGRSPAQAEERRELAARISELAVLRSLPSGSAKQLDRARPAPAPVAPRPARNAIFAFVLSIVFGAFAAYGVDRVERRIRRIDDVTPIYDAPVLGTIPRAAERLTQPMPPVIPDSLREPFRTLRTSLELAGADYGTLLITSGLPGEGKSTIARNLAMAYLESGREVVIVEADLRRPSAARWLSTPDEPGLAHVLSGEASLDDALHEVLCDTAGLPARATLPGHNGTGPDGHSENGNLVLGVSGVPADLFLLPAGSHAPDPPTLLGSEALEQVLVDLAARFDVVLIDTPALLSVSDALPLLRQGLGTLVVSRLGTTTEKSAERVAEVIGRVQGAQLLGVIANDVPASSRRTRYGYPEYQTTG
jgi:Mrp family chromosome partitioning ATPase/capsular polysaccharide biosynthesis protein